MTYAPVALSLLVLLLLPLVACRDPAPPVATAVPTATALPPSTPAPVLTARRAPRCRANSGLPDPSCTPGKANPGIRQDVIVITICQPGYTATVRPPVSVTDQIKLERMTAYGFDPSTVALYELDHLISLELGGDPLAIENLWPERWDDSLGPGAHLKDHLENELHARVCSGKLRLLDAQVAIVSNWERAYTLYVGPLPK